MANLMRSLPKIDGQIELTSQLKASPSSAIIRIALILSAVKQLKVSEEASVWPPPDPCTFSGKLAVGEGFLHSKIGGVTRLLHTELA